MGFTLKEIQNRNAGDKNYLLYVSSFPGFTLDLFRFDFTVDHHYNYRLRFSYFDPKIKVPRKPDFYCEGILSGSIKEILQKFILQDLNDIYAYNSPNAGKYVPDDIGHYSYKIKNGSDFLGATLYYPNPSHIERFENNTGKQFYNLHCKIVEWIESLYGFIKEQQ